MRENLQWDVLELKPVALICARSLPHYCSFNLEFAGSRPPRLQFNFQILLGFVGDFASQFHSQISMNFIQPAHTQPATQIRWQRLAGMVIFIFLGLPLSSCERPSDAETRTQSSQSVPESRPINVDVAIASRGQLQDGLEYTGTTAPMREVSLRSQVEGQVLELTVDVGDRVQQGQVVARLDDRILRGSLNQARAEKAAQRSAVVSAQSQVGDALIKVEQARLQLQQAEADITRLRTSLNARVEQARLEAEQTQVDADRLRSLAEEGATAAQAAEQAVTRAKQARQLLLNEQASADQQIGQAQTAARTAAKILRSAEAQVAIERQRVSAAEAQVAAQKALIDQSQSRQSFATLRSPIAGKVISRASESGNLVQPGTEILSLGDFSRIKVEIEVSELKLGHLHLGQPASVTLDAFPTRPFKGTLTRISPAADPTTRLVPVEIAIDNPTSTIGSGLLARVRFDANRAKIAAVSVPETALNGENILFVVKKRGKEAFAEARLVKSGNRANGQVEILDGLSLGEAFVVRSSQSLKDKTPIRISILSKDIAPSIN